MVLALEPMVVMGQPGIKKGPDGFVYQTADHSLSAHFEHTVVVTERGPRILTE
jgi:methionyl aminopeptidase